MMDEFDTLVRDRTDGQSYLAQAAGTSSRTEASPALVRRARVIGCGSALPRRRMTNAELAQLVDTSDEWIVQRSGIRERRVAVEGETTSVVLQTRCHVGDTLVIDGEAMILVLSRLKLPASVELA